MGVLHINTYSAEIEISYSAISTLVYSIIKNQQEINDRITSERDQALNECRRLAEDVSKQQEINDRITSERDQALNECRRLAEDVSKQQEINDGITSERVQAWNECRRLAEDVSCLEGDDSRKDEATKM